MSRRASAVILAAIGTLAANSAFAASIVVTDDGDTVNPCAMFGIPPCTLRDAITFANLNPGADTIVFQIVVPDAGLHTIRPASPLPAITEALTIDGYTQPQVGGGTAHPNTLAVGNDALILIEIDGSNAGALAGGLIDIQAGPTTVKGLAINRAQGADSAAIEVAADGATITGNFIGTDPSGALARGNGCNGVRVVSSDNLIGGSSPADRNVISATGGCGINLRIAGGDNNMVRGNYIGTDAAGTGALGGLGIDISGTSSGNTIGGTGAGEANVISGNDLGAIRIRDAGTTGTLVQGNSIGVGATGNPRANGYGVSLSNGAHDNTIGGDSSIAGNVIAFNNGAGVSLQATAGAGNAILSNSIHSNTALAPNTALGIDLGDDGVTPNDNKDPDLGPNRRQNFPILTFVTESSAEGTLNSRPNETFTLQFFANSSCDPSGYGEGETLIQTAVVMTDANGDAQIGVSLTVPPGKLVTATATDIAGNTSEFSQCTLQPAALQVDTTPGAGSDGNGVFEPGETVSVEPAWANHTGTDLTASGQASGFAGPAGGTYTLVDDAANYGAITAGSTGSCAATSNCYSMSASVSGARPATHWDAEFTETLSILGALEIWKLHLGESFTDVPRAYPFYRKIETVLHHGFTVGCTVTQYCATQKVRRDQMGIFLARAIAGGAANIPTSGTVGANAYNCVEGGVSLFDDIAPTDTSCKGVHYIASQNVTAGCGPSLYCPAQNVKRDEMGIFVARGIVAPAGGAAVPLTYGPDPVTALSYSCDAGSPNLHFTDVLVTDSFCKHVHFLWAKGIIAGCSATQYCTSGQVGRDEMAKFLSNAFAPNLYGP